MNKIRINQGRVIPSQFRFFLTVIGIAGIVAMVIYVNNEIGFSLCLIIALALFLVWTSFAVLEVDADKKLYKEYYTIMGRPFNVESALFEKVEYVFIKESLFSQTMYSRGGVGHTTRWKEYEAYLVVDQDKKVLLISDEDRNDLLDRLKPILKKLKTEVRSS